MLRMYDDDYRGHQITDRPLRMGYLHLSQVTQRPHIGEARKTLAIELSGATPLPG